VSVPTSVASESRRYAWIAALLVAFSVLATIPVLEMGVNDDFSYNHIVRDLAATGHLTYNGWAGAMIGAQAWWAACFVKLFGFSFTLIRLTTLPLAIGCALLLFGLGRRAGLNPAYALFGALAATLSPVFIPMAASFMTDVPGFFLWLVCVYCAVRAVQASQPPRAIAWAAAAAVSGIAAGSVRQVFWATPLLLLPMVAVGLATRPAQKDRRAAPVIACAALWCASLLAAALLLRWFNAQPYVTPVADAGKVSASLQFLLDEIESALQAGASCLLLLLPALFISLAGWKESLRRPLALAIGLAVAAAFLGTLRWAFHDPLLLGNIITPFGVLEDGTELLGSKPEILPHLARVLLAGAILVSAGFSAAVLMRRREASPPPGPGSPRLVILLLLPPSLVYAAAVLYRAVNDWILFDRYMIPLFPMLLIPLLWQFQRKVRRTPPLTGWVALGLFAIFGIATTHDYLASGRARVQAAAAVTASGVPRTQVTAGLEYDGWTELETTGHISGEPLPESRTYPIEDPYFFWEKTPSVDPRYFLVYTRQPELVDAPFPQVPFTAWLPPFHRQILTQMAPR
jgi:hypothetical protein